ncbi:MAG: hypothetical protein KC636_12440, partial [Myxococcales bacterium]|nr:hypothetical protein [Myxococcales bacterium]
MDALSFWGWGRADGFPDVDTRRQLGQQLQLFLGLDAPLEPTAPPELAAVTIADPRVLPPPALASFCSSEREPRIRHTHGRGYPDLVRGFRGEF